MFSFRLATNQTVHFGHENRAAREKSASEMLALNCPENLYRKSWEPPTVLPATHIDFKETEDPTGAAEVPPRSGFSLRWEYIAIVLVILLIAGIRFRLRDFPLERDEGEYAYAGQLILQGIPPYQLAYNMKLPGTYAAYAAVMAVFGQTPAGIHSGIIIVNAASIFLVFLITKKLFDPTAAAAAGAIFGLFTIRPILVGLAGHATHFVTLVALASIYLVGSPGTELEFAL